MNLIKINKPEYQPLLELIPNFVSFLDKRNTASDQRSCGNEAYARGKFFET